MFSIVTLQHLKQYFIAQSKMTNSNTSINSTSSSKKGGTSTFVTKKEAVLSRFHGVFSSSSELMQDTFLSLNPKRIWLTKKFLLTCIHAFQNMWLVQRLICIHTFQNMWLVQRLLYVLENMVPKKLL